MANVKAKTSTLQPQIINFGAFAPKDLSQKPFYGAVLAPKDLISMTLSVLFRHPVGCCFGTDGLFFGLQFLKSCVASVGGTASSVSAHVVALR